MRSCLRINNKICETHLRNFQRGERTHTQTETDREAEREKEILKYIRY